MIKKVSIIAIVWLLLSFIRVPVYASSYVLPYPSSMPGSNLYTLTEWWDRLQQYWYFGEMGGLKYHRAMADKYLVEAKTLFEYQQYKLASDALQKSDEHFSQAVVYLIDVNYAHKDDGEQGILLKESAKRHTEVIDQLDNDLPASIVWHEEKKDKQDISLDMLFTKSKTVRNYADR